MIVRVTFFDLSLDSPSFLTVFFLMVFFWKKTPSGVETDHPMWCEESSGLSNHSLLDVMCRLRLITRRGMRNLPNSKPDRSAPQVGSPVNFEKFVSHSTWARGFDSSREI